MKHRKTKTSSPATHDPQGPSARAPASHRDPARCALRLEIDRRVLATVLTHGAETPEVEICGVLLGDFGDHGDEKWVRVTASIRGENAREEGAHVTLTHETWDHIHRELDANFPGLEIVGWYHTHPGFGVFLSDMDMFIQRSFFGQPHHVSLVFDPLSGEVGAFTLRENELVALENYWRDGHAISLRRSRRDSTAVDPASTAEVRDALYRVERAVAEFSPRPSLLDWAMLGLMIVLLLLQLSSVLVPRPQFQIVPPSLLLAPLPGGDPLSPPPEPVSTSAATGDSRPEEPKPTAPAAGRGRP